MPEDGGRRERQRKTRRCEACQGLINPRPEHPVGAVGSRGVQPGLAGLRVLPARALRVFDSLDLLFRRSEHRVTDEVVPDWDVEKRAPRETRLFRRQPTTQRPGRQVKTLARRTWSSWGSCTLVPLPLPGGKRGTREARTTHEETGE